MAVPILKTDKIQMIDSIRWYIANSVSETLFHVD